MDRNFFSIDVTVVLFLALGRDKFAVETCDIAQRNIFGTFSRTCSGVGAVAETEFVHFGHHFTGTAHTLHLTLGQQCELADLGGYKEHGRAVFTCCHASAAAYTCSGIHGHISGFFRNRQIVGILCAAAVEADVAAGLLDFVERVAVHHKVFDDRERC